MYLWSLPRVARSLLEEVGGEYGEKYVFSAAGEKCSRPWHR